MAKPLTSWLVPSFSQHNLLLVVSGCRLHISVTKFQDKFACLRQVNSSYSWNKFQISCTDIIYFHVFVNFARFRGITWILPLSNRAKYQKPWNVDQRPLLKWGLMTFQLQNFQLYNKSPKDWFPRKQLTLFPENLNVSPSSASVNIEILGKEINYFPLEQCLLLYHNQLELII